MRMGDANCESATSTLFFLHGHDQAVIGEDARFRQLDTG